jgi:cyclopropane fatty-acyl-phospholipid synthase-like methyltransferase
VIDLGEDLARALGRPAPFTPHDAPFWNDPYIGSQMLAAHLDATTDAASRRPATIVASVDYLGKALKLEPGARLLDLGCGPGLYATQFAERRIVVTGIDLSPVSIAYARAQAKENELAIDYRLGDYSTADLDGPYDVAVLIYLDFGVLPDSSRDRLLEAVHKSLRRGGTFAFDVKTPRRRRVVDGHIDVTRLDGGFWRPGPHLLIETIYRYDGHLDLDQHTVVDARGMTTYRVWDRAYSRASLERTLAQHGFSLTSAWMDLTGTPWSSQSPTIAVAATRN